MNIISEGLSIKNNKLFLLDQTKLPHREDWLQIRNFEDMDEAIKSLRVRGAPLIGVAAALCSAVLANDAEISDAELVSGINLLAVSRPTAVNLGWAMSELMLAMKFGREKMISRAFEIYEEDVQLCARISEFGSKLIVSDDKVLTHCNAGGLATAGVGTAIGVIKAAYASGTRFQVLVDETRPLLQGARLTAFELQKAKIPYRIICDNMAGHFMQMGEITKVVVGADRIASNGDAANKIGTYSIAVLAKAHNIPFYIAAPYSTFDFNIAAGSQIEIEERASIEALSGPDRKSWAPTGAVANNPAFDVTPSKFITGWITDRGVLNKIDKLSFSNS